MTEAGKRFGYLVVLVVIAATLGTPQRTSSTASHDSARQAPPGAASAARSAVAINEDASGVIFISKDQVAQSYAKGAVLYNGNPERNYRVHIFHRDGPGEVEVHSKDTDVLYILEGSATFVTGGKLVGGKETAPFEVRGPSMDGGVVRPVTKGDVIIVPPNVTHWFKEVQQPITYFGVKVR